ncbi:MAG: hypothetical protein ISS65_06710 [Desulfobacterales bacterium]|uniref:Uncharacterized protein n=1 Tax=Candidatus Desulfatibia profunda TaxID=2841695 RepID=A0A8J6NUV3_9BACT|nr:hypothetical protein [Candidatus Desulfatibia profunda]MBL7179887.1 hypothetical protein [Desulfobacterales bacterium]
MVTKYRSKRELNPMLSEDRAERIIQERTALKNQSRNEVRFLRTVTLLHAALPCVKHAIYESLMG